MFYSGALISGAFSGLIAAGVKAHLNGARGMLAWRWLFIIEGVITIFIAMCSYFILPNFPRTTTWLTEEERQLAIWLVIFRSNFPEVLDEFMSSTPDFDPIRLSLEFYNS